MAGSFRHAPYSFCTAPGFLDSNSDRFRGPCTANRILPCHCRNGRARRSVVPVSANDFRKGATQQVATEPTFPINLETIDSTRGAYGGPARVLDPARQVNLVKGVPHYTIYDSCPPSHPVTTLEGPLTKSRPNQSAAEGGPIETVFAKLYTFDM